jgi:uncharacterized RDD family membrane protein YckC
MNTGITYAGFWKRFVAYILDKLIIGFVEAIIFIPVLMIIFIGFFSHRGFGRHETFTSIANHPFHNVLPPEMFALFILVLIPIALLNLIGVWLYFSLMESSAKQATLGKIIMSIKVVDSDGKRISFGKASGRFFGKILSGLILGLGFIMAGFTERKQALHDILANCLVVDSISLVINEMNLQNTTNENLK